MTPNLQSDPDFIPAQTGGADPDFIPAQTPPPPMNEALRPAENLKGIVKGAGNTVAGLMEMYAHAPGGTPVPISPGLQNVAQKGADWIRQHTVIHNPAQQQGNIAETIAELLIPGLGEEGALTKGAEAGVEAAPKASEYFAKAADMAKALEKHPILHAAVRTGIAATKTAARAGAEQAGQTFVKTGGDVPATIEAGKTGAEWGGALGGAFAAAGEIPGVIEGARPGARTVAGAEFETTPKTGELLQRNLKDVTQDPATQAVDEALGNVGKTAVANSMNRSNAARAPEAEIIPPSRRLPGRAGFTLGPAAEPTPAVEGQTAFDPGKQHIGTKVVAGKGPGQFNLAQYDPELASAAADRAAEAGELGAPNPQPEPQGSHKEPIFQYRNQVRPGSPEPGTDIATGPGTMILTDDGQAMSPERARQQLKQYKQILGDPDEVEQMGVRQHQAVQAAHDDLAGQLSRYDNFAASQPHFPALDPMEAVRNTDSLGDAAEQIKAAHTPFWQAADQASGGEFSNLRDEEKRLEKQIYGANPTGRLDDLRQQLAENQQKQMDFFDKYKTTVSPQEWDTARSGYQDGIVLGNLDNMLQQKFGGISRELEQRGIATGNPRQRVFQPSKNFNQELENFYNQGFRGSATNREVLQRTIGPDHMDALHDLGLMFNSTERMQQTQSLTQNILTSIRHHYHGVRGMLAGGAGAGMLFAGQASKAAGFGFAPMLTGTAAGINRYIGERLITDPEFLKTFSYALKNGIPPRTAGPLLAARLISSAQNQQQQQQVVVPADESRGVQPVTLPVTRGPQ